MERCIVDTSTLSDVIRPAPKRSVTVANNVRSYLRAHRRLTLSEISCYEVLRGLRKAKATRRLSEFAEFCRHSELLPVTFEVLDRAATLWATGQAQGIVIEDNDLIIAATAMVQNAPLVTANPKHFSWIAGLRITNWRA